MAEEKHHTEHVPEWKKNEIENIKELIQSHKVFGMVGIEGILATKIQKIRRDLKDVAVLKVSRNTLTERALNQLGESIPEMNKYLDKQTALVFTNESPFKLYKVLEQTKTPSPIFTPSHIKVWLDILQFLPIVAPFCISTKVPIFVLSPI